MMDYENPVQLISVCSGMGRNLGMTDSSMVTAESLPVDDPQNL